MAYIAGNPKTKKDLKSWIAEGRVVRAFQPNDMFGDGSLADGEHCVEGPHYPQPHRWYAVIVIANGHVVKVR